MKSVKTYLILLCSVALLSFSTNAQKDIISYGIQFKPIIPVSYFSGISTDIDSNLTTTIAAKPGYSFGMVVRRGFTNTIALEFGLNYVRRNYNIFLEKDSKEIDFTDFGYISYEIPIQALLYAKLSDKLYLNGSGGFSFNFFASNVNSNGENELLRHQSYKTRYVDLSILTNVGFEYRTLDKGYFYLGGSFHLPLHNIADSYLRYDDDKTTHRFKHELNGSFLTLDLRYFFPETTKVIKKEKKKKD